MYPKFEKQEIAINSKALGELTNESWEAIFVNNGAEEDESPWLYNYGSTLVRLVPGEDGRTPVTQPVTADRLRNIMDRVAFHYKTIKDPTTHETSKEPVFPNMSVINNMLADPENELPRLLRLSNVPLFGPEGKLQQTPGYSEDTQVYYHPSGRLVIPEVVDKPTQEEAVEAKNYLFENLLVDFPFENPENDRLYVLGMLLEPFVRNMIHSFTPLYLIDKPMQGTGASLLAQCIVQIATGGRRDLAASINIKGGDVESDKKIFSVFRDSPIVFFIDNIIGNTLKSKRLVETMTSHSITDRVLGASEMATYPVRCMWVGTGNNPAMERDMVRRTVRIRLDAHMANPENRKGFKHTDLPLWLSQNLPKVIHAVLTIAQYWVSEGRPLGPILMGGGFEHWSQVIGGILTSVGLEGFFSNKSQMHSGLDDEDADWRAFTFNWWDCFKGHKQETSALLTLWSDMQSEIDLGPREGRPQLTKLGKELTARRDKHLGPYKIIFAGVTRGKKQWRLETWEDDQPTEQGDKT